MTAAAEVRAPVTSRLPAMPTRPGFLEGVVAAALTPEGLMLLGPACMALALGRGVTRWSGVDGLITAGWGLLGIAVGVLVFAWTRPSSRMCGRTVAVRTGNSNCRVAARHEAGHYAVAQAVGGRVRGAAIYPDGSGVTVLRLPRRISPAKDVAVDVAGHVASGTSSGCDGFDGSDFDQMRDVLATLPKSQRDAVQAEGYRIAERVCHGLFSSVPGLARRLERDKQIGRISC